jgi:hypothetical protein
MAKIHISDPGFSAEISYSSTVQGGTTGTQPTFNGAPLFDASYAVSGNIVHFRIKVLMTNITSFGTGQYYMTLPYNVKYDYYFRGGHLEDASTGDRFSISGNVTSGSNIMYLTSTASNGKEVSFSSSVPVNLATADNFHIYGEYIRA